MLDKRSKRVLIIFGAVVLLILITEVTRPIPVNWNPSYTSIDKVPFGSYVMYEELEVLFDRKPIQKVKDDPYVFLSEKDVESNSAYLFINDFLNFDKRQIEELKTYVEQGNTVFMSARYYGGAIEDSLNFTVFTDYSGSLNPSLEPAFFHDGESSEAIGNFDKGVERSVFTKIDTASTYALGYLKNDDPPIGELNFIKMDRGDGSFYFHTMPEAFSNYYLLQGKEAYAARLMSYIEADNIYWDDYLKSGRRVITTPMRFVLNQEALRWAYYVLAVGLILFVIFRAKREQRIIPVVKPLENTSVEFSKTIGQMYFQHRDYSNIIAKKINYFLEIVRSRFYLDTTDLDSTFVEKLALKSGNNTAKTEALIGLISHLKAKSMHNEADLIELNKKIERFNI